MDSKLFIHDLFAAYVKYAKRLGFKCEKLSFEESFAILKISGENVYKHFKNESGKHCVQRIPPTERGGRTHTSILSVAVLPMKKKSSFRLDMKEVEIHIARGSGKGGQARNKLSTAVQMVHRPTGLTAYADGRSQSANKEEAVNILSAKIEEQQRNEEDAQYNKTRCNQVGNRQRSDKRRTYNFCKNYCKDHVFNKKTHDLKAVMDGHFELILQE